MKKKSEEDSMLDFMRTLDTIPMLETILGAVIAAITATLISMWQVRQERKNAIENERIVFFEQQKINGLAGSLKECETLIFILDEYRSIVENEISVYSDKSNKSAIDDKMVGLTKRYTDSISIIRNISAWYCFENIEDLKKVDENISNLIINRNHYFSFTEGSYLETQKYIQEIKRRLMETQVSFISRTIPKELLDPEIILEENKKK